MKGIPRQRAPALTPRLATTPIKFRFHYAIRAGRYSCKSLSQRQISQISAKLKQYKLLTALQFRQSDGVHMRNINITLKPPDNLSEDIKNQLAQHFRVSGRFRIFGYIWEDEFFVIWFDPDHQIAP